MLTSQLLKKELPRVSKKILATIAQDRHHQALLLNPAAAANGPISIYSQRALSTCKPILDKLLPAKDFISWDTRTPVKIRKVADGPEPIQIQTMLKKTVEKYPDHTALTIKRNGVWQSWSYSEYLSQVEIVAKAFHALGLKRYQGVAIMAANCPEWYIASLGTIFAGGISSGIYTTNSPDMVSYVCDHAPMSLLIFQDMATYEQALGGRSLKEAFPTVERIILLAGEAQGKEKVMTWSQLLEFGVEQDGQILDDIARDQGANEAAMLLYTSGTTGPPKGNKIQQESQKKL